MSWPLEEEDEGGDIGDQNRMVRKEREKNRHSEVARCTWKQRERKRIVSSETSY